MDEEKIKLKVITIQEAVATGTQFTRDKCRLKKIPQGRT